MRYFLYDVLSDYSTEKVDDKSDFGTLAHAKQRGVKDNRGQKVTWRKVDLPILGQKKSDKFKNWFGRNKHNELIYVISTHGLLKNPGKKVMKRKKKSTKKRSAKQLANDKRLGRMAKARAAKRGGKKKSKKKTTRKKTTRKNPHTYRKGATGTHKKPSFWRVFRCRGNSLMWVYMDSTGKWNWTSDAGKAILFC